MKVFRNLLGIAGVLAMAMEPLTLVETSGGPLGDLFELLDYLTEEIKTESLESDRVNGQLVDQCKQETEFREVNVVKFQEEYLNSKIQYDSCKIQLDTSEKQISQLAKDKIVLESPDTPQSSALNYEKAFKAIDNCVKTLEDMSYNPSALLQLGKTTADLLLIPNSSAILNEITIELTQISKSTHIDVSAIADVTRKLQSLKVSLKETHHDDTEIGSEISEKSVKLQEKISDFFKTTEKALENAHTARAEAFSCVNLSKQAMSQAETKELNEAKVLKANKLLCEDWENEYSEMESERAKELKIIQEILEMNEKYWGKYGKTAVDRADFYKEEWDNYSNAYVYKSQYGYQHDQIDFKPII